MKFCSLPLRVAVITIRFVQPNLFKNGALAEAVFTTTNGRRIGFSHSTWLLTARSGPRRLNRASLPSKVPLPIKPSHRVMAPSEGASEMAGRNRS